MADSKTTPPVEPEADLTPGKYVVVGAGACYAYGGDTAYVRLGLQGRVIDLVDEEAMRLLNLGAVRAATEADLAREAAAVERETIAASAIAGPAGNPYGGTIVGGGTLEQHAAAEIAKAHAAGQLPPVAPAPAARGQRGNG